MTDNTDDRLIMLRNGQTTFDPRLDRIPQFDDRSRMYGVRELVPSKKKPRSKFWRCRLHFDQGTEGACVGFANGHELAAKPAEVPSPPLSDRFCRESIYWEAQRIDDYEGGAYPGATPQYEGTSVLAGAKVLKALGAIKEYRFSFGLDDLILGVGYFGPAVMGTLWYSGMYRPDRNGHIHVSGDIRGGHSYLVVGVDVRRHRFRIRNSWGRTWGDDGEAWISFKDMLRLLQEDGEAVFYSGREVRFLRLKSGRISMFPAEGTRLQGFDGNPQIEFLDDGRRAKLLQNLTYTDGCGHDHFAKAGMIFDGASIPRWIGPIPVWSIIGSPFTGAHRRAAVIHDAECEVCNHMDAARYREEREMADATFLEMLFWLPGVSDLKALVMWKAVRVQAWWRYMQKRLRIA